jgi:hypothetical protein
MVDSVNGMVAAVTTIKPEGDSYGATMKGNIP